MGQHNSYPYVIKKRITQMSTQKTSSRDKELTPWGIKIYVKLVKNLKQKLCGYSIDALCNDAPRHLPTGKIIEAGIVSNIIRVPELGLLQYKAFINDRLIKGPVKFYTPIKKNKLNTGIK